MFDRLDGSSRWSLSAARSHETDSNNHQLLSRYKPTEFCPAFNCTHWNILKDHLSLWENYILILLTAGAYHQRAREESQRNKKQQGGYVKDLTTGQKFEHNLIQLNSTIAPKLISEISELIAKDEMSIVHINGFKTFKKVCCVNICVEKIDLYLEKYFISYVSIRGNISENWKH